MPIEVDYKLKDLSKPKEDGPQDAAPKRLLTVISTLEDTNKPIVLHRLTPLPISEKGAALGEQAINSNILQSSL